MGNPTSARALALVVSLSFSVGCHSSPSDAPPPDGGTTTPPSGASSAQKIDAAVAAGQLDPDTAILYHLYALYGPDLMPPEYLGDDSDSVQEGTPYFRDAAGRLNAMSADIRAKIEPFLARPTDPASFWAQHPASASSSSALRTKDVAAADVYTGKVDIGKMRIWYTASDQTMAKDLAAAIQAKDPWGKYKAVLGIEPPPDGTAPGDHGESDAIDIYLVRGLNKRANTTITGDDLAATAPTALNYDKNTSSSFVIVDARLAKDQLIGTVYHELFHCFQNALPGIFLQRSWFDEATAEFMIDWVDDHLDAEHSSLKPTRAPYTQNPGGPLDLSLEAGYGAYLFPFYVSRTAGAGVGWIGEVYGEITKGAASGAPVKHALQVLGARTEWKDWLMGFTVANLNLPPEKYLDHGQPFTFKQPMDDTKVDVASSPKPMKTGHFPHSGDTFDHVLFPASATPINKVTFDFSSLPANVVVQAIKKMNGKDTFEPVETWTGVKSFCRDRKEEAIDSVYILLTNISVDPADDKDVQYTVTADDKSCTPPGAATLSYTGTMTWKKIDPVSMATGTFTYTESIDSVLNIAKVAHDDSIGLISYTLVRGVHDIKVNGSGSLSGGMPGVTSSESDMLLGSGTVETPALDTDYWPWTGSDPKQTWPISLNRDSGDYEISLIMPGIKLTRKAERHTTWNSCVDGSTKEDAVWDPTLGDFVTTTYDCMSKMTTVDTPPKANPIFASWSVLADDVLQGPVPKTGPIDRKVTNTIDCASAPGPVIGGYDMDTSWGTCSITYTAHFTWDPPDRW